MSTGAVAFPEGMDAQRVLDINRRLCEAYLVQSGIQRGPMPDLADVSLEEAMAAARMVEEAGGMLHPDGSQTYVCHVSQNEVARVFARVVVAKS